MPVQITPAQPSDAPTAPTQPATMSFNSGSEEHNLTRNFWEEDITKTTVVLMVLASALWAVPTFAFKVDIMGYVGIVGIFTAVQWMPYLMAYIYYNGMYKKLAYAPLDHSRDPAWIKRAIVAHNNAMENFFLFACAVFFALSNGADKDDLTFWGAFYLACRAYYCAFTIAPPIFMMKTALWFMGWIACAAIFVIGLMETKTDTW